MFPCFECVARGSDVRQLHELTGAQKFEENVSLRAIANMLKKGTLTGMNQNKMLKRVGG